jgi:predicted MFS family arabinose efflux permease
VIANFLAGTATTALILFLSRFLDGITGGNLSVAQAVLSDVTTPERRAEGFGIFGAAFGLGFVLGPAISLMAQQFSLGASFLASSLFAGFSLLVTILFLPETLKQKSNTLQNIFDLGLENLVKGAFMPKVGILLVINLLIGTTFTIFTYAFQPYFIHVLSQTSQSLTLMFVTFGVMGLCTQTWGTPLLIHQFGLLGVLLLALLVRSLSFMLMPVWANVSYFVGIGIVFSIFNSLVQPMINSLISLNAKPEEQGLALGVNASYLSISNAFGPLIAGLIVDQAHPITYSYALYLAGILTFFVFLLAVFTRKQYAVSVHSPS